MGQRIVGDGVVSGDARTDRVNLANAKLSTKEEEEAARVVGEDREVGLRDGRGRCAPNRTVGQPKKRPDRRDGWMALHR